MRTGVLLLAAALLGCPGGPGAADGGLEGDLLARRTLADGGVLVVPPDLRTRTITVYAEAGQGFTTRLAEGREDGTFVVPDAPSGRYLVESGDILVSTTSRFIRLGDNRPGRPDAVFVLPGEGLELGVDNLAPWTAEDELQLASWNAGIGFYSTAQRSGAFIAGPPDGGATALVATGVELSGEPRVEASRGDDLTLLQLSGRRLDGGVTVKTAVRSAALVVDMVQGGLTPVQATLVEPAGAQYRARVATGQFVGLESAVGGTAYESRWVLSAHLGPFGRNTVSTGAPDLAIVAAPASGELDVALTAGNPFPASWERFVSAVVAYEALYQAPTGDGGVAPARSEVATVSRVASVAEAQAGALAPLVSPVREVRLDGQLQAAWPAQVGRTPVIGWIAPAIGAATYVDIQPIELMPGPITRRTAGPTLRVVGDVSQVRLPPGFLTPGAYQYLRITAVSQPPEWDPQQPRRDVGPPAGAATLMTPAFFVEPLP